MSKIILSIFTIGLLSPVFSMVINPMDSPDNMAQSLIGPGINISNVSYTGAKAAAGYFSGGISAGIGMETGIVLTSGYASNLHGNSNTSQSITGYNQMAGDADLESLIPGHVTYDASVLEFDFISSGEAAYFNYCFGSDEYNEYVGSSFNDVFGFFFEGNNIALVPGTTTPVSINNVNLYSNSSIYNNNANGAHAFEYDGFTNVLTASMEGLTKGQTYHIKLAVADAGDYALDAGVFIQAGSFSESPGNNTPVDNINPAVPEPGTMMLLGLGMLGMLVARRKK